MPEGDSLVRLADRLRPVLAGRTLTRTDFRVPQLAVLDLAGRRVDDVRPRAKYLLVHAGDLIVLSHLKMDGSWETYPLTGPDGRPRTPRWRHPDWQARCVLQTPEHQVVGFQLGMLEVVPSADIEDRLGFLGPDLLSPEWDDPARAAELLDEGVRRLAQEPHRPVGLALLDQRLVSGIGNIYRCESLLLAGLDPHRPISSVNDLPGLVLIARDLLRSNVVPGHRGEHHRVTTGVVSDPKAPYGVRVVVPIGRSSASLGQRALPSRQVPPYWVYHREHEGCLRCGGPVTREDWTDPQDLTQGSRQLWWCRRCQR